jgi:hypothetical protein
VRLNLYSSDIIVITESWLHYNISDCHLKLPNFHLFRDDRSNKVGGGVAVWASCTILPVRMEPCKNKKPSEINCVWLKTTIGIFCNLYIPPDCINKIATNINDYIIDSYDEITTSLIFASDDQPNLFLCGDFNRFDVNTICNNLDVVNIIDRTTRAGSSVPLDLVLVPTNQAHLYNQNIQILPPLKDTVKNTQSDHYTIYLFASELVDNAVYRNVLDLRKSHMQNFVSELKKINWSLLYLHNGDIDTKCNLFYDMITPAVSQIPMQRVKVSEKDKPWISPVCKIIEDKINTHKDHTVIHDFLQNKLVSAINNSKQAWAANQIKKTHGIWKIYHEHSKSSSDSASLGLVQKDGIHKTIQNLDTHYTSAYGEQSTSEVEDYLTYGKEDNWTIDTTVQEVENMLINLPSTGTGSDDFHPRLLSAGAQFLSGPICHLFHVSVQERRFPKLWKLANMVSVPKRFKVLNVTDLRGISLLPIISKLLEKIIIKKHKKSFEDNFGKDQYAYRSNSSTLCCAIKIHDFATSHMDKPMAAGLRIISFDMSRAFETVPHHLLMKRLASLDYPSGLIRWVASYLLDRSQRVKLYDHYGKWKPTTSSVPQGSCLGPFLFSIFMESLKPTHQDSLLCKFADDIELCVAYFKDSILADNIKLSDEIKNIMDWTKENGLTLNTNKTKQLTCTKRNMTLPDSTFKDDKELRILGFIFQPDLGWDTHINQVVLNASRKLFALKSMKSVLSNSDLIKIYYACVRSVMEYGSALFIGTCNKNLKKLDEIQKRASRIMNIDNAALENLNDRRVSAALKLMHAAENNNRHLLHSLVPHRLPRTGHLFINCALTNKRQQSFIPYMSINHNN